MTTLRYSRRDGAVHFVILTSPFSLNFPFPPSPRKTVCFVLSYLVDIPIQHIINALLVFGLPSILSETGKEGGKFPSSKR